MSTRTERIGAAVWLLSTLAAACGDPRERPAPLLGPGPEPPRVVLLAPVDGDSVPRDNLAGSGVATRIHGAAIPVPARIRLSAHALGDAEPFFSEQFEVTGSAVSIQTTIRAAADALTSVSAVRVTAHALGSRDAILAADSVEIHLR